MKRKQKLSRPVVAAVWRWMLHSQLATAQVTPSAAIVRASEALPFMD
jgi:hypothetical protein